MKRVLLAVGIVSMFTLGGYNGVAEASSGAQGSSDGWAVMFSEGHNKKYDNGKYRVKGFIAQVCKSSDGHSCDKNGKQTHVRHGVWKWFWPNGTIKAKRHFHLGHLQGKSKAWYANGQKRWVESFDHGKLHGERVEWFNNGKKKSVTHYKKGRLHGAVNTFWWSGTKSTTGSYVKGKKNGAWHGWYLTGQRKSLDTYKEGKRHGLHVQYWYVCRPGGCGSIEMQRGFWKNGKKDGTWKNCSMEASGKVSCQ